jgi:hypothetical protein
MRTKVKAVSAKTKLTRILNGLEQELIEVSDEEVLAAAQSLGMDPRMRGSAAFAGIKYMLRPQLSDFFEFDLCRLRLSGGDDEPSS